MGEKKTKTKATELETEARARKQEDQNQQGCSPETYPTSSGTFWPHHQKNSHHWAFTSSHLHVHL